MKDATNNKDRLEYLRTQIRNENISMGELIELQGLANEIDPGDVELLEWAGVPEFPEEESPEGNPQLWVARVKRSGGGTFHGTGKKTLTSEPMSWEDANNWVHAWMDSPLGDVISGGFQEAPKDARSIYPRDNYPGTFPA